MDEGGDHRDEDVALLAGEAEDGHAVGLANVGCRLSRHDAERIELKLYYRRPHVERGARYRVELYFFIPPNLGIKPGHYERSDFFADMQDYTRYRAPILSLGGLADFASSGHPLAAVRRHTSPGRSKMGKDRLVHAIKLYGATFTQALEDERLRLQQEPGGPASAGPASGDPAGNGARLGAYLGVIRRNLEGFRTFRAELAAHARDARVAATLDGIDEYLSLEVEDKLLDLLLALEREKRIDEQYRGRIRAWHRASYRASLCRAGGTRGRDRHKWAGSPTVGGQLGQYASWLQV